MSKVVSMAIKLPPHHFEIDGKLMTNSTDEDYFVKWHRTCKPEHHDENLLSQAKSHHWPGMDLNEESEGLA